MTSDPSAVLSVFFLVRFVGQDHGKDYWYNEAVTVGPKTVLVRMVGVQAVLSSRTKHEVVTLMLRCLGTQTRRRLEIGSPLPPSSTPTLVFAVVFGLCGVECL